MDSGRYSKATAGTSSTESQMNSSLALADVIAADLTKLGWPAPVRAMSGNGAYLLYRTDESNSSESDVLFEDCLYALIQKYSPHVLDSGEKTLGAIGVDKSVHNASRIAKAIGTFARKGVHTDELPHRNSWFVPPESTPEPVSTELLQGLASTRKDKKKKSKEKSDMDTLTSVHLGQELSADNPMIAEMIAETRATLATIPQNFATGCRRDWIQIGMALHHVHSSLLADWIKFSKPYPQFMVGECEREWNTFSRERGITDKTLNKFVPDTAKFFAGVRSLCSATDDLERDREEMLSQTIQANACEFAMFSDDEVVAHFNFIVREEARKRTESVFADVEQGMTITGSVSGPPTISTSEVADPIKQRDLTPPATRVNRSKVCCLRAGLGTESILHNLV